MNRNPHPPRDGRASVLGWLTAAICAFGWALPGHAQDTVVLQFPNSPVSDILREYELITGKKIIRDAGILGATLPLETGEVSSAEAARLIEQTLLLNGFALVPAGPDTYKVVAYEKGKDPRSEGVPVLSKLSEIPFTDQVITFLYDLDHMKPEDAAKTLGEVFPAHGYGAVTPLPHAGALLITENSSVLRRYLEVLAKIDLPPEPTVARSVQLERGDAAEVAEALTEILGLDEASTAGGTPAPSVGNGAQTTEAPRLARSEIKVRAIPRSNSVFLMAPAAEAARIEQIIHQLDAPALARGFRSWKLNYLPVASLLPIAADTLSGGLEEIEETGEIRGADPSDGAGRIEATGRDRQSGMSSSSNASGFGESGSLQSFAPQSLVVGRTLLIGDNAQNTLFASGPAEKLALLDDLLAQIDVRSPQIQISAVIAQLTLGDEVRWGLDLVRTADGGVPGDRGAGALRGRVDDLFSVGERTSPGDFLPLPGGLSFYGEITALTNAYIDTLESKNRFKVLARPTVYTLNNRKAVISSGQRIAVPSSTLTNIQPGSLGQAVTASISFEEVLLEIEVIPLINADDEVTLQIYQINDDIVGSQNIGGNDIPTIGTQRLLTTVMVPNESTVLLGGLISEDEQKSASGLPIFVNVPFVGPLFGSAQKTKNRQELLIFIQPKIIRNSVHQYNADRDLDTRAEVRDEAADFAESPVVSESRPKWLENRQRSGMEGMKDEARSRVDDRRRERPAAVGGRMRF